MDMNGKVVLVTGGGSGMGQLACRLMSERGARVAALDVNEEGLAQTAQAFHAVNEARQFIGRFVHGAVDGVE